MCPVNKVFFLDLFWFSFISEPFLAYSETWFIDVPSNFFFLRLTVEGEPDMLISALK